MILQFKLKLGDKIKIDESLSLFRIWLDHIYLCKYSNL